MDPDAAGTYQQIANYAGFPAFRRLDGAFYIWFDDGDNDAYILCDGEPGGGGGSIWVKASDYENPYGNYNADFNADGIATFTAPS